MSEPVSSGRRTLHTTCRYDAESDRFTVVADVGRTNAEDLRVFVGQRVVHLEIDGGTGERGRTVRAPENRRFTDDRQALFHNGVLEVTVGVTRGNGTPIEKSDASA